MCHILTLKLKICILPPGWGFGQAECRADCSNITQLSDQGQINLGKQACYAGIPWLFSCLFGFLSVCGGFLFFGFFGGTFCLFWFVVCLRFVFFKEVLPLKHFTASF